MSMYDNEDDEQYCCSHCHRNVTASGEDSDGHFSCGLPIFGDHDPIPSED